MLQARILEKSEEHLWEDFIKNHPQATIHQTPNWGHFQAAISSRGKYWIVIVTVDGQEHSKSPTSQATATPKIIAGTLLIRHKLPKGYSWLYAARGPLLDYENKAHSEEQMEALLAEIKKIAKQEKAIFLRIDPPLEVSAPAPARTHAILPGFHSTTHGFQPQHTLVLDLTKAEQEILTQMKPKGRYNIKIATREGVKISISKDLTAFYKIFTETTSRDGFHGHDQNYYEKMIAALKAHATLYLAEYNGKIIAGAIITYFGDTATYYFGASSSADRNVMAPYLLHWQAIQDAKKQGYKFYDFFGIAPANTHNHPWSGVTDFKKKFGGTEITYAPAQEHAFKKILYKAYKIYKNLKKS